MKKSIFYYCKLFAVLSFLGLVMSSCEKGISEDLSDESGVKEDGNVILRVSSFRSVPFDDPADENITRAVTDLSTYCKRLVFAVYKDGKKVEGRSQKKDDDGFGQVSMSLAPGNYKLFVLAHSSAGGNPVVSDPEKVQFTNSLGYSDTFSYYGNLEVTNSAKKHDIVLVRNVSCLRFVIQDEFPSDVKFMRFNYTGGSGVLNAVTGYGGSVNSQQEKIVDITPYSTPLTFNLYTFLQHDEAFLQLKVEALQSDEKTVVLERTFEDVPMRYRMVTEYTGSFFNSENSFTFKADTDWGDPYVQQTY